LNLKIRVEVVGIPFVLSLSKHERYANYFTQWMNIRNPVRPEQGRRMNGISDVQLIFLGLFLAQANRDEAIQLTDEGLSWCLPWIF